MQHSTTRGIYSFVSRFRDETEMRLVFGKQSEETMAKQRSFAHLIFVAIASITPCVALASDGKFVAQYGAPKDSRWAAIQSKFRNEQFLEIVANQLNSKVSLPKDVPISLAECGQANAFFNPSAGSITLCFELIDQFTTVFAPYLIPLNERGKYLRLFQSSANANEDMDCKTKHMFDLRQYCFEDSPSFWQRKKSPAEIKRAQGKIRDVLTFFLYHEAGHAMASILNLPVTGKEEDSVDQLAAYLEISDKTSSGADAAVNAAVGFNSFQPAALDLLFNKMAFADEHSLGRQRFYNVLCWVYGSDTQRWAKLVTDGSLPTDRGMRCRKEYSQLSKSWKTLLSPYAPSTPGTPASILTVQELIPVPPVVRTAERGQPDRERIAKEQDQALDDATAALLKEESEKENKYPDKRDMASIRAAISSYAADHRGAFPPTIEELTVNRKYLQFIPGKKYLLYDPKQGEIATKPRTE